MNFKPLILAALLAGCSSSSKDLDGTWLVDLHVETRSDTGEQASKDFPGYELVVDRVGSAYLFGGVLGSSENGLLAFGSKKYGSLSEDGDWDRGWWSIQTEGWASIDEAEIAMRIEVWDMGGTEILGLSQEYHFTNFSKLEEPKRP